jgi:hypothetical protein
MLICEEISNAQAIHESYERLLEKWESKKMPITENQLEKLAFKKTHRIEIGGQRAPRFVSLDGATELKEPCVYFWLGKNKNTRGDQFEVLYVGKAKSGPCARMRQHENGFRNSVTGRNNKKNIKDYISDGKEILVFTRKAGFLNHLGDRSNAYSLEEEILYKQYRPRWNRQRLVGKKPSLSTVLNLNWPDELRDFRDDLKKSDQRKLDKLLIWAVTQAEDLEREFKLVGGYSGLPRGFDNKPLLVCAKYNHNGNMRQKTRLFAIPLHSTPDHPVTMLIARSHTKGANNRWIGENALVQPKDLEKFIAAPSQYFTK